MERGDLHRLPWSVFSRKEAWLGHTSNLVRLICWLSSCPQPALAPREGLPVWEHKTQRKLDCLGVVVSEEKHSQLLGFPETWGNPLL